MQECINRRGVPQYVRNVLAPFTKTTDIQGAIMGIRVKEMIHISRILSNNSKWIRKVPGS